MKKLKIINIDQLEPLWGTAPWEIKYFNQPPIPVLGAPSNSVTLGSADISLVSNYSGPSASVAGLHTFRYEPWDAQPFNASHFSIWSTDQPKIFTVKELHHQHFASIPADIESKIPSWFQDFINRLDAEWELKG